jgi:site-specific recombinase XerD
MPAIDPTLAASDLESLCTSYLRHLATTNLSPRTRVSYREAISQLAAFLRTLGLPTAVGAIRREHIQDFIADLLARHSVATAANRFAGLRAFFNWLEAEGEIDRSPMARMRPPRQAVRIVPVISQEDLRRLLGSLERDRSFEARRDLAIMRTFLATGARLSEIANLRYLPDDPANNDVDLDRRMLRVMGKGARERLVSLSASAVRALDRYERLRRGHRYAASPWLWLGTRGRMTANGIGHMISERGAAVGLRIHTHQFRHTWTHESLAAGMSELNVQQLGGWRDGSMLRRYGAQLASERALAAARVQSWDDNL